MDEAAGGPGFGNITQSGGNSFAVRRISPRKSPPSQHHTASEVERTAQLFFDVTVWTVLHVRSTSALPQCGHVTLAEDSDIGRMTSKPFWHARQTNS
jgi:hypothetical protein